jgi:putative transposase
VQGEPAELRTPPEVVLVAWILHARRGLSLREVAEALLQRGLKVSHEAVRRWLATRDLEAAATTLPDFSRWNITERMVWIKSDWMYLWLATDAKDSVIDLVLQLHRKPAAARRQLRLLIQSHAAGGSPARQEPRIGRQSAA